MDLQALLQGTAHSQHLFPLTGRTRYPAHIQQLGEPTPEQARMMRNVLRLRPI